jgi:hypothetical protein
MCFSASASFVISAALMAGGIAAVKRSQHLSQLPFALIPLIFALQQFSEGLVWLSLTQPEYAHWQAFSSHFFLVVAQVVWPVWVPFSMWLIEKERRAKKAMKLLILTGFLVSSYLGYCMFVYPVTSVIAFGHIRYDLAFPFDLSIPGSILYFIATVIPAFVSSVKKMSLFGFAILGSFVISRIFFSGNVISVWCFFAAGLSIMVLYIIATSFKGVEAFSKKPA